MAKLDAALVHSALSSWEQRLLGDISRLASAVRSSPKLSVAALNEATERLVEVRLSLYSIEAEVDSARELIARSPPSESRAIIITAVPSPNCVPLSSKQNRRPPVPRLRSAGSPLDEVFTRGLVHTTSDSEDEDDERYDGAFDKPFSNGFHASVPLATQTLARAVAAKSPILANAPVAFSASVAASRVYSAAFVADEVARKLDF